MPLHYKIIVISAVGIQDVVSFFYTKPILVNIVAVKHGDQSNMQIILKHKHFESEQEETILNMKSVSLTAFTS